MALHFYNTLSRKKELFKPIREKEVHMYSCGPTVYNYVHLGNLRAYIFVDLLRRYLKYKGFKLKHVMNITDIDDKTIRDSQKEGKSLKDFTEFYTAEFLKDLDALNIERADILPKATGCIDGMVSLIQALLKKGIAYKAENGDIYFAIAKFKDYGKLANLDIDSLKKNADGRLNAADEYVKEDARDFALWKIYEPEKDGDVFWDTEIGKGRPGWHIECSVMSSDNLGQPFDIHTGGVDLIFPHHTNEIAQSEAAHGKKFVNYWLHNAHLIVNGQKMSKSLGNFYTLRDLLNKGYDVKSIRYELLSAHYRAQLDFREEHLKQLPDTIQKFYDFLDKLDEIIKAKKEGKEHADVKKHIAEAKKVFEESLDDDLNISGALAAVFTFMTAINRIMPELNAKDAEDVKHTMLSFDTVLGVMHHEKGSLDEDIEALVEERQQARKNKDWKRSDEIRDALKAKGIILEDTPSGVRWKRA